jgi:hypothetical protein
MSQATPHTAESPAYSQASRPLTDTAPAGCDDCVGVADGRPTVNVLFVAPVLVVTVSTALDVVAPTAVVVVLP